MSVEDDGQDFHFYAYVEVREWGEPDREERTGPYTIRHDDVHSAEELLRHNLSTGGDIVNRIERITA